MRTSLWRAFLLLAWLWLGGGPVWAQQLLQWQWGQVHNQGLADTPTNSFFGDGQLDEQGNTIMSGYYRRRGVFGQDTLTSNDTLFHRVIVKLNPAGNMLWATEVLATNSFVWEWYTHNTDGSRAWVKSLPNGQILVAGSVFNRLRLGNFLLTNPDSLTVPYIGYLAWLDANGAVTRAVTVQGIDWSVSTVDSRSNVYLAGQCANRIVVGADACSVPANDSLSVGWVKIRPNGRLAWGGSSRNGAADVILLRIKSSGLLSMRVKSATPTQWGNLTITGQNWIECDTLGQPRRAKPTTYTPWYWEHSAFDDEENEYRILYYGSASLGGVRFESRHQNAVLYKQDSTGRLLWVQRMYNAWDDSLIDRSNYNEVGISQVIEHGGKVFVVGTLSQAAFQDPSGLYSIAGQLLRTQSVISGFVAILDAATGALQQLITPQSDNFYYSDFFAYLEINKVGDVLYWQRWLPTSSDTLTIGDFRLPNESGLSVAIVRGSVRYNTLTGTVFIDANADGIRQPSEAPYVGAMVSVVPGPQFTDPHYASTAADGTYAAYVPAGDYAVNVNPPPYYQTFVGSGGTPLPHNFAGYGQTATRDFALVPIAAQTDLWTTLTPAGRARPGFPLAYHVSCRNVGTTTITGADLQLSLAAQLQFDSASVAFTAGSGGTRGLTLPTLAPNESFSAWVWCRLPTSAPLGSVVQASASVPVAGDLTPADNQETARLTVTGSYDPNDLTVNYTNLTTQQVIAGDWLEYTVRFQNMGTDTAFTVIVRDSLPLSRINLNTGPLQIVPSHNCLYRLDYNGVLTVTFPSIVLPPRSINQAASDGFVRFRVRIQPTLVPGDSIHNQAAIHFDYNAPLWTNQVVTIVDRPLGLPAEGGATLQVWPNPARERVQVALPEAGPCALSLLDALGREVRRQLVPAAVPGQSVAFDVRGLPLGYYTMRGLTGQHNFTRPLLIR